MRYGILLGVLLLAGIVNALEITKPFNQWEWLGTPAFVGPNDMTIAWEDSTGSEYEVCVYQDSYNTYAGPEYGFVNWEGLDFCFNWSQKEIYLPQQLWDKVFSELKLIEITVCNEFNECDTDLLAKEVSPSIGLNGTAEHQTGFWGINEASTHSEPFVITWSEPCSWMPCSKPANVDMYAITAFTPIGVFNFNTYELEFDLNPHWINLPNGDYKFCVETVNNGYVFNAHPGLVPNCKWFRKAS